MQFAVRLEPRRLHDPVDATVDHDRDLFGYRSRDADILLNDEDTDFTLFAEADQNFLDLLHNHRRESLGRLVHNEEPRVEKQRARNREHLLLAAGELIATIGSPFRKARERLVDA